MTKPKTPKHGGLPITFAELGALLGTRELLRRNLIQHVQRKDKYGCPDVQPNKHLFDMNTMCKVEGCGSVACIGGTMAQIMALGASAGSEYVEFTTTEKDRDRGGDITHAHSNALHDLFYPPEKLSYGKITTKMALRAIDNFLDHGKPNWMKIRGINKALDIYQG